jgi:hypothetical protein
VASSVEEVLTADWDRKARLLPVFRVSSTRAHRGPAQ